MQIKTEENNEQKTRQRRMKKFDIKMLKLLSLLRFFALFFLCSVAFVYLSLVATLIVFSITDCNIEGKIPKRLIKRTINDKLKQFDIDFDSIYISKTPVKKMIVALKIKNIKIVHKQTKVEVVNFDNLDVAIPVKKVFFGSIIPVFNRIENKIFLIPYSFNNDKGQNIDGRSIKTYDNNQKNNSNNSKNDGVDDAKLTLISNYTKLITSKFTSLIDGVNFFLVDGLNIKNVNFAFFERNTNDIVLNIKIINSTTKITQVSELNDKQHKMLSNLLKRENETKRSKGNFIMRNFYENVVVHSSNIEIQGNVLSFDGFCNTKNGVIETCLFKVTNLPTSAIMLFSEKSFSFTGIDNTIDGDLFVKIKNNNIDALTFNTEILVQKPLFYKGIKIDINKIRLSAIARDNLKKIESIEMSLSGENVKDFCKIHISDFYFSDMKPNCKIKANVSNLRLSELIHFSNTHINSDKSGNRHNTLIDGSIDGTVNIEIRNGNIIANDGSSQLELKKNVFADNSEILIKKPIFRNLFKIKVDDDRILLNLNMGNDSKMDIFFDKKNSMLNAEFKDFLLKKTDIVNLKDVFLQKKSFEPIESFDRDVKINGTIQVPIKNVKTNKIIKDSTFDVRAVAYNTSFDGKDEITFDVKKKKNTSYGSMKVDFGNSIFKNEMFGFDKKKDDRSVILGKFTFDGDYITTTGKWSLNEREIVAFNVEFGDESSVSLRSDDVGLNIRYRKQNVAIDIIGKKILISEYLWRIIMAFDFDFESELNLNAKIEEGMINGVKFKNLDTDLRIIKLYIDGYLKGSVYSRNGLYSDLYYENRNGNFIVNADDVSFILTLFGADSDVRHISISANGSREDNKTTGAIDISIDYNSSNLQQFNRVKTIHANNFEWSEDVIQMIDADFHSNWFDILGDFKVDENLLFTLEGRIKILMPFDKIKYIFVKKPQMTKSDGYSISKVGHSIDEFAKNLTINDVDLSLDEKGSSKNSLLDVLMK